VKSQVPHNHESHAEAQGCLQRVLLYSFAEAKVKNPSYSLRAFAKKLKISPSALSEIFSAKRSVSLRLAEKVLNQLNSDPIVKEEVLNAFLGRRELGTAEQKETSKVFTQLSMDQFKTIADWYHFAILSLFETTHFEPNAAAISERLGIRTAEAEQALERLERLGMICRSANNRLELTGKQFHSIARRGKNGTRAIFLTT
jgi:DNA-binding MarR family transcriptional regulator